MLSRLEGRIRDEMVRGADARFRRRTGRAPGEAELRQEVADLAGDVAAALPATARSVLYNALLSGGGRHA